MVSARTESGPVQLSALGVGAIIGTGIFILTGRCPRSHGPGADVKSFVRPPGLRFRGAVLRRICFDGSGRGLGLFHAYATLGTLA